MSGNLPGVTVIIPVLNEERHLAEVVAAVRAQDYSGPLSVVIAVGSSRDRTAEIAADLARQHAGITVVQNPSGRTPDGLNAAIAAATGEIIIRCDGHAFIPPDYVSTAVRVLEETGADNIGGIMDAQGETDFQRAVAWAMKSRYGVGAASFHVGGQAGPAETVYLGCFRASALKRVGGYDPAMTRAQDWEMNHRIIETGGKVWFTPELRVTYRPRRTLAALSKQYRQYGEWRRLVMKMHPETARRGSALRYFAPPAVLFANLVGIVGAALAVVGVPFVGQLALAPLGYAVGVGVVSLSALRNESIRVVVLLPWVLMTMHMSWGWGFLTSRAIKR